MGLASPSPAPSRGPYLPFATHTPARHLAATVDPRTSDAAAAAAAAAAGRRTANGRLAGTAGRAFRPEAGSVLA